MPELLACFVRNETGAAAIEYSLIAAATGLAVFGAVKLAGPSVKDAFNNVAPALLNDPGKVPIDGDFQK
jgi:Flp pilus assembly pilin Flp